MRYKIQYRNQQEAPQTAMAEPGANLLEVLRAHQATLEAACNGRGICGKCRVQVTQGHVPVTEEDRLVFTPQELAQGYRLACRVRVSDHLAVHIQGSGMEIRALGMQQPDATVAVQADGCYHIAVDLGSTTLAAGLVDAAGNFLAQASAVNSQRIYGADVVSRMQASNEGNKKQLQACICRDLEHLFQTLLRKAGKTVQVSGIAIAGNTVMLHLLRGYSCEKLGRAPFEPVNLKLECLDYGELFEEVPGCGGSRVYLLPGMSAFIGADITAGLYSSGFCQAGKGEPSFFIDLGTNGELAYGGRDGFVTASTAAGPAFEGARLSCGIPGIPGAIAKVSYLYHRVRIQTIGQKKPCGICGTGAMEAAAALRREGLMDADGLLAPQLQESGMLLARREDGSGIFLTQADIREIQMAKAAIRAGIEVLQKKYQNEWRTGSLREIGAEQEGRVYLAGGFGYYLSADAAVAIGLFPPEWKDRIVLCGNTSLKGAAAFLSDPSCAQELENICSSNHGIRLESEPGFQDSYIQQMRFPDL